MTESAAPLQIGELARRVGVSAHVLRSWERRYALLHPVRTHSGYRMYSASDEARIREVLALREQGISVATAAAQVLGAERATPRTSALARAARSAGQRGGPIR